MTAEEVALQQFRAAVINLRVARKIRNADTFGLWFAVASLARIIRAIRRENRGDRMRASYEASVSEQVIHAETAWYDRGYEQGYEQGRRDALRGVQGACWYLHGNLWLDRFPLPSSDERRAIAAIEIAMQAKAAEEMTR